MDAMRAALNPLFKTASYVFLYVRKQQCDICVCYYGDLTVKTHSHPNDFDGMLLLSIPCVTLLQLFCLRNPTFRIHVYVYNAV